MEKECLVLMQQVQSCLDEMKANSVCLVDKEALSSTRELLQVRKGL